MPGIHGIKQNNNPIPTRITRRFDNRPKIRYVKSNWKITSDKCWINNNISSSPFDQTSKRASNVTNSSCDSAKLCKEADFRTHRKWKDKKVKMFQLLLLDNPLKLQPRTQSLLV